MLAVSRTGPVLSRGHVATAGAARLVASGPHRWAVAPLARWGILGRGCSLPEQGRDDGEYVSGRQAFRWRRHALSPATASAEGHQFNGGPPATASAEGAR